MNVHTRQLRYFTELADCLNFTKAARNLGITQPALSQQIADLEKQLAVTLFRRSSRSVSLTPAGEILKEACPQILHRLEDVAQQLIRMKERSEASLRIGYLSIFEPELPSIIHKFRQLYPDISLNFFCGNVTQLKAALENGEIDMAFAYINMYSIPDNKPTDFVVLRQDDLCITVTGDHPFCLSGGRDYRLLEDEICILVDENTAPGYLEMIEAICAEVGFNLKNTVSQKDAGPIVLQVGSGYGISLLPSSLKNFVFGSSDEVAFVPVRKACLDFGILWQKDSASNALPLFLNVMKNTLDSVPDR